MTKPVLSLQLCFAFLATLLVLLGNGLASWWNINELVKDDGGVFLTQNVLKQLAEVRSGLGEAESSQRGYLLTGVPRYLVPYQNALPRINQALDGLRGQTRDNPVTQERLEQLQPLIARRLQRLQDTIRLYDQGEAGREQALERARSHQGELVMDQVRDLLQSLVEEEQDVLRKRLQTAQLHVQMTRLTVDFATLIGVGLLIVALMAVRADLRKRQQIEEVLRQSEARFRLLADTVPQIVWTASPDGKLDYYNRRLSEYCGPSASPPWPVAGGLVLEAVHPDDRASVKQSWQQALQTAGTFEIEFRLRRASDGAFRWHLGRALPFRDSTGQVLAWFGTSTDIEDHKRVEQAALQANEELERRVTQRTRQLEASNQELRRATLLAEAASRTKSEFLASVSHEIRTPLNGILGMAEILLDTPLTDRQREYLGAVQTSADSLLTLLNEILDFSKVEAGKLELQPAPFDLRQELDEILKPLALRAQHKGLRYHCLVEPAIPSALVGDCLRLRQVLLNLVGNAIKFTETGDVTVSVRLAGEEQQGDRLTSQVHFVVADTGIGIPAEKLQSIFEPFVQGDNSLSRKYGGTGLGLSISGRLVEMMGGRIEVASQAGKGSTFSFTIPLVVATGEPGVPAEASREIQRPELPSAPYSELRAPVAAAPGSPGVEANGSSLRVLLVEDNDFNRQVGVYLLEKQGYRVAVARSGLEALDRLERETFDLVLMDLGMPGMDGLETTVAIRQREASQGKSGSRRLPIIALTAHVSPGDRERSLQAGMDGHISKPLDTEQLRKIVARLVKEDGQETGRQGDRVTTEAPAPLASLEPVFNLEQTLRRLSGNRKVLAEAIGVFCGNAERLLAEMRQALAEGDAETLRRSAHTLKGSMSFFSAAAAMEAARRVEKAAGDAHEQQPALLDLEREVGRLRAALVETTNEEKT